MGVSGQLHVLATLLKRKYPPVPSEWEVDWAPEHVGKETNHLSLPGIDPVPLDVQSIA